MGDEGVYAQGRPPGKGYCANSPVSGYAPVSVDEPALSSIGLKYLYTSRPWVAEGGVYWVRARWYAPAEGRFLSLDPQGYAGSGLSLYMYAGGDPVNMIDPLGESWFGTARQWADKYRDGIRSVKDAAGFSGDGWGGSAFDFAVDVGLPDDAAFRIGDSGIAEWVFGITTDLSDPCPRPLTGGQRWGHLAGELGNAIAAPGSIPFVGKPFGLGGKAFKHGFAALGKGAKSSIWSATKRLTPAQNAYGQWKRHGRDFPQFKSYPTNMEYFFGQ